MANRHRAGAWLLYAVPLFFSVAMIFASGIPRASASEDQSQQFLIGAYIAGAAHDAEIMHAFESQSASSLDIVTWYQPWGADKARGDWYAPEFDGETLLRVTARGALPFITWEPWGVRNGQSPADVSSISAGHYDAYIDSWAEGLKEFGGPVFLRPFHEMNNPVYPWAYGNNGNTAQDLIDAWRYLHDRVAQAGAVNVIWVWSPNTEADNIRLADLYPGDEYVDWFGVDGYNGGDVYPEWWGGWASPEMIFDQSFRAFTAINPNISIMIAETSSVEQGGNKAAWITELYTRLPDSYPQLRAIIWFNEQWGHDGADWRMNSSPEALAAFRAGIQSAIENR